MTKRMYLFGLLVVFSQLLATSFSMADESRPNIIWIVGEDMGPDLGCWGSNVHTPNIDQLAAEGMRFTRVFGTASVCMPNRTAMATGVTQTTLGSVTMRPPKKFMRPLPAGVEPLPTLLRQYGYYSGNIKDGKLGSGGKDDWNFQFDGQTWDTRKMADLTSHQPFYAQFNFPMAHRPFRRDKKHPVDPDTVDLPPYYPDHSVSRRSWADYLESIQHLDRNVGRVMNWLNESDLTDNTIVIFLSDHGEAFLRGKYFCYDCSLNQPLIIRWPTTCQPPATYQPGGVSNQLISGVDITAQTVDCAGGTIPDWMHGRAFLADGAQPRDCVFSASDWIGGSKMKSRTIRTDRYRYIHNYTTEISVHNASTEYRKYHHPLYPLVDILDERGELSRLHRKLLVDPLPPEELYDLENDPHEINNLAADPKLMTIKKELKARVDSWIQEIGDLGFEEVSAEQQRYFEAYKADNAKKLKKQQEAARQKVLQAVLAD